MKQRRISRITQDIVCEWKRKKEWERRLKRQKQKQDKNKNT